MSTIDLLLLLGVGLVAGVVNTLAGGGSLLTLPLLIFMGLPSVEANASNRVGVFFQNLSALKGFTSKGVSVFPYALWVGISAVIGGLFGALIAIDISNQHFNKILAIIMLVVMALTVFKPYFTRVASVELFSRKRNGWSIVSFFFIGVYSGFLQAGVGLFIIALLTGIHGLSMAKTNSIKVFVNLGSTTIALAIFIWQDLIRWEYGLLLAVGNAVGGWIASRWSVDKDEKWIRLFLAVTVAGLALKLWFFS